MINYFLIGAILVVVILVIVRVMTKSWIKTGYITELILSIITIILIIRVKNLDPNLLVALLFLSLGLLINAILGLSNKK